MTLLTTACMLVATAGDPTRQAKVIGASLFKNGYAVVVREATIPSNGILVLTQPSNVALGTFWVTTPRGVTLKEIVATTTTEEKSHDLGTLDEIIQANKGKTVAVTLTNKSLGGEVLTGTILSASGQVVVFRTDDGVISFNKGLIIAIRAKEGDLKWTADQSVTSPALRISGTPNGKVFYTVLQRGLTWAPAYQLDISDPQDAVLTAKATVVNDLEPIKDADIRLVTGFPNIPFLNVPDPFSATVSADAYLGQILGRSTQDMLQNRGMPNGFGTQLGYRAAEANIVPLPISDLEGFSSEDLFFYRQDKVDLKRGDRGYYVLLQFKSRYSHIYTLNVPQLPLDNNTPRNQTPLETWHELKVTNTSKQPLTTGTVVTVKDGELLGQDMLTYTPAGGDQFVKITKALDVSADQAEEEVSRTKGEIKDRFNNPVWDLVTIHGKIVVTSRKKDPIKMKVEKELAGEAVGAGHEGKTTKFVRRLYDVNTPSKVTWEVDVKPGEKLELDYTYKLYQPSR